MKRPGDNNSGNEINPKNVCYSEESPNILEDSSDEEGLVTRWDNKTFFLS